jgi:hypothetical protein
LDVDFAAFVLQAGKDIEANFVWTEYRTVDSPDALERDDVESAIKGEPAPRFLLSSMNSKGVPNEPDEATFRTNTGVPHLPEQAGVERPQGALQNDFRRSFIDLRGRNTDRQLVFEVPAEQFKRVETSNHRTYDGSTVTPNSSASSRMVWSRKKPGLYFKTPAKNAAGWLALRRAGCQMVRANTAA